MSLPLTLALACTTPPSGPNPAAPPATSGPPSKRTSFTANNDARGAGSQPDYDGEAAALRNIIAPRLPTTLPDPRAACTAMLDAAAKFYDFTSQADPTRDALLADLKSTRPTDQTRCEQDTNPRAATCVALRLADRDAEFPWLLDQCTRAFPD